MKIYTQLKNDHKNAKFLSDSQALGLTELWPSNWRLTKQLVLSGTFSSKIGLAFKAKTNLTGYQTFCCAERKYNNGGR